MSRAGETNGDGKAHKEGAEDGRSKQISLHSAKNGINAKDRISLIVKLLYESHLQIL